MVRRASLDREPTDKELREIEQEEGAEKEQVSPTPALTVQQYLDQLDLERMEWDRVMEDLYPSDRPHPPKIGKTHKDTDPIQEWLSLERHL